VGEGVMLNTLFSCGGMRQGSHHLYDDLDRPKDEVRGTKNQDENGDTTAYDQDFD
jgi:hypothetical protein